MNIRKLVETTVREYLRENSNSFAKWFSGSKIIDSGKPLVCYHGSPDPNIKIFDMEKVGHNSGNYGHYGYGIYFSTDVREARTYGKNIYKCYINISNPFSGTDEQILQLKKSGVRNIDDLVPVSIDFSSLRDSFAKDSLEYRFLSDVERKGYEYAWEVVNSNLDKNKNYDKLNDLSDVISYTGLNKDVNPVPSYILDLFDDWNISPEMDHGFEYNQSLHWITDLGNESKEVTDAIIKLGYDGVFYGSEVIAFKPNQIKSIDNDGTWDKDDNDIYS